MERKADQPVGMAEPQLDRHSAALRPARDVSTIDADAIHERDDIAGHLRDGEARLGGLAAAAAAHVGQENVEEARIGRHEGCPASAMLAESVQKDQRRAFTLPIEMEFETIR